jgi:hypothetical protein
MPKPSEVEIWLRANGAAEYVAKFQEEQFTDLRDVDEETIKRLVPTATGLQRSLTRLLAQRKKAWETPEIPALPPGTTLDLSEPKLPDGSDIKLPSLLSDVGHAEALASPFDLEPAREWPIIAKERNLLLAFVIGSDKPARAHLPALVWKVPKDSDFVQDFKETSEIVSTLSYSERDNALAKAGFDKLSASASYLFSSASMEASRKKKEAQADKHTTLYVTSMWRYPRARLFLEYCTEVSPKFVAAVEQAFARHGGGYRAFKAMEQVFGLYGHVMPWSIVLGGQLFLEHSEEKTASTHEASVESTVQAALSLKVGGFGGNVSGVHQEGTAEHQAALDMASRESIRAAGGDTLLATSPKDWTPTVAKPLLWATIQIEESRPTVELLPAPLRERVLGLWRSYKDHDDPAYPQPLLADRVVSIQPLAAPLVAGKTLMVPLHGHDTAPMRLPLVPHGDAAQKRRVTDLVQSVVNQDRYCESELHPRVPGIEPLPGSRLIRVVPPGSGNPKVLPSSGLPGVELVVPSAAHTVTHRWRIAFSGERDEGDHAPLYWIEHEHSGRLLGWDTKIPGSEMLPPLLLVDPAAELDPTGAGLGALWRIDAVDPQRGAVYAHAFQIRHFATRRELHLMEVCREALGDDTRLLGGGPCLYARFSRPHDTDEVRRARFDAACWVLTPLPERKP